MTQTTPTIAEQVTALQANLVAVLPEEVLAGFGEELASLQAHGLPAGAAVAGTPLPDGDLLDTSGHPTTLDKARAGRPAVVVFYRGAWCPYCSIALRTYQQQLVPALEAKGIGLIAVSPQRPDGSLTTQEANELTFTVVSDPGNQVARRLGILNLPRPEASRRAALSLGVDVAAANIDGTDDVPMPTVLLVDASGTIRWIDVHPDYTTRTETDQVLAAVAAAGLGAG